MIAEGRSAAARRGSGARHPGEMPISAITLLGRSRAGAVSSAGSRLTSAPSAGRAPER